MAGVREGGSVWMHMESGKHGIYIEFWFRILESRTMFAVFYFALATDWFWYGKQQTTRAHTHVPICSHTDERHCGILNPIAFVIWQGDTVNRLLVSSISSPALVCATISSANVIATCVRHHSADPVSRPLSRCTFRFSVWAMRVTAAQWIGLIRINFHRNWCEWLCDSANKKYNGSKVFFGFLSFDFIPLCHQSAFDVSSERITSMERFYLAVVNRTPLTPYASEFFRLWRNWMWRRRPLMLPTIVNEDKNIACIGNGHRASKNERNRKQWNRYALALPTTWPAWLARNRGDRRTWAHCYLRLDWLWR